MTRGVHAKPSHTLLYAVRLDDRFQKDEKYPNQWREIQNSGAPKPYSGMGCYVQVSELTEPQGALLVEMHFILHEPPEWFGGPNLLRSKLPIAIRDNVQNFRRKVSKE